MNLENYFISNFNSKHIGDDCAHLENDIVNVYSKDAFFENVHFKLDWMSFYQVARKAMMVNISDAVAMNAKPKYALLSVAMPKNITKSQMRELVQGFKDAASEYNIEIIGGDTISNIKLDITVTILSHSKKPLYRKGIRNNYLIAYSGNLGRSKKDLSRLINLGKIHKKSKFVDIKLRDDFIKCSMRFLASGMDISDGLYSDLSKLAEANNIGFKFHKKISKCIGCSGEEYEMLVAFDKRYKNAMLRRSRQSRTKLNIFATSIRSRYKNRCKAHHF